MDSGVLSFWFLQYRSFVLKLQQFLPFRSLITLSFHGEEQRLKSASIQILTIKRYRLSLQHKLYSVFEA